MRNRAPRGQQRMNHAGGRTVATITSFIVLLGLDLCLLSPRAIAASDDKPSLTVFLEKSDIRENDSVRVHFQVTNGGAAPIATSSITIISPGNFMEWHCGGCAAGNDVISKVDTGRVEPNQSVDREAWFHTKPDVPFGQFNLLFRLEMMSDAKPPQRSVSLVEKAVSVKLLGTDTLAGIPLALSGLVVPGLCFWLIVSWFGVSWGVGLALGDKIIYSVLVSFALLMLDSRWVSADISSGLSVVKLVIWASSGVVLGALVGALDKGRRLIVARREAAITIGQLDDDQTVFRKLLVRYLAKDETIFRKLVDILEKKTTSSGVTPGISNAGKPFAKVFLKNTEVYCGSLVYQDKERTRLVGWYKLNRSALENLGITQIQDSKKVYREILKQSVTLEQSSEVQQELKEGGYKLGGTLLTRSNDQVLRVEWLKFGWNANPLEIVTPKPTS